MRNRGSSRKSELALGLLIAILTLTVLFALFAPLAAAGEPGTASGAVSVQVTVAPSARVFQDGSVSSNVSTVSLYQADLLTFLPR